MSGLAGFVALDGARTNEAALGRMAAALSIYGPGGVNVWRGGTAAMAFAPFATTPEALQEHQPVRDEAAQLVLCLDGRLDNRRELLGLLASLEPVPPTAPDSAVLLALIKQEGMRCLPRLVGDYAFACWDARRQRLFCARSPIGWRTFHWHANARTFAFATDPKALLALPWVERRLNEPVVGEILALRFTSPTETLWSGVHRLGAGWALTVENGPPRIWRWQAGPFPAVSLSSDEEYAGEFRLRFDESLRSCARGPASLAIHLSGGLDSSSVLCRAVELSRQGQLPVEIQPVSAVYPGEPHDESRWINAVEAHTGVETARVTAKPYDWEWAEGWSRETLQLPLRPNTSGTLVSVCEHLRQRGIRVLLTGEGGDDWFTGSMAHWPDLLLRGRWRQLLKESRERQPGRPLWRAGAGVARHGLATLLVPSLRRALIYPHLRLGRPPEWIRPDWARRIGLADRVPPEEPMAGLAGYAQLSRSSRYDFARAYVNWENVLTFAATQQIELRHPFHDLRLTRFAMGLPGGQLQRQGRRKHLLREAMRGTLPEVVRARRDKAAFITPFVSALAARAAQRPLTDLVCVREGWVDPQILMRTLQEYSAWHESGASSAMPPSNLGGVWIAVAIDLWLGAQSR